MASYKNDVDKSFYKFSMQTHYFYLFLFLFFFALRQRRTTKKITRENSIMLFCQFWYSPSSSSSSSSLYWHAKKKTKYTQELPKFNFFSFTQMSLNYCMKSKLSSLIKNFFFSIFNGIVISLLRVSILSVFLANYESSSRSSICYIPA